MKKTEQRAKLARVVKKYIRLGLFSSRADVFSVCKAIRGSSRTLSEAKDLFAVWELVRYLKLSGHIKELAVFEKIYLDENISRQNYVSMKMQVYADKLHYDVRTLYRHLKYIEDSYSAIRKSLQ